MMTLLRGEIDFVKAASGVGLGPAHTPAYSPGAGWAVALGRIQQEQLTGLAVAGVEAGELSIDESQREELWTAHREAMARVIALERRLIEFGNALESNGIEFIVLKGPALAHGFYADPAHRGFRDIDVLVHTRDLTRAAELLGGLGFARDLPEPREGFDVRYGKAICHTDDDGLQVDLHRSLVVGPFGVWIRSEELFEGTVEFPLGGRSFRRLGDEALFLHACVHAALGWRPPLLMPLRDVVATAGSGSVDWRLVAALGARWKLLGVVRHAIECALETIPGAHFPEEAGALRTARVSRRERRALASYVGEHRARGGTARSMLWALKGPREKLGYLRSLAFPDRPFLEARSGKASHAMLLKRWRVPLRWMAAGLRRSK